MGHEPRYANGHRRRDLRNRLKSENRPCWICVAMGRRGAIDYSLKFPHPYSFEVDELVPVSRYWLGGYESAQEAALDYKNLAATHRCCNQWRSNRTVEDVMRIARSVKSGKKTDVKPSPIVFGRIESSRNWRRFRPSKT